MMSSRRKQLSYGTHPEMEINRLKLKFCTPCSFGGVKTDRIALRCRQWMLDWFFVFAEAKSNPQFLTPKFNITKLFALFWGLVV